MMNNERSPSGERSAYDRRTFLSVAGTAASLGLAGCTGGSSGGDNTATIGILNPMSGAYSTLGPSQRAGAEYAVQQINESDEYSFEIDPVYYDTETNASAASQAAQQAIQEDGADYLVGAISSSAALGLNELAASEETVYFAGGAAVPITGEQCNQWVFRFETNTAQIAEAVSGYTVEEIGSNVWFHYADYAYGTSVYNRTSMRMEEASDEFTEVGESSSSLGSSNYESYITQIGNSDADVAVLGMTGGDLVTFVNQAADRGLTEDVALVAPTMAYKSTRAGTGPNSVGTYGGVRYDPSIDIGDNQAFVEGFQSEYDEVPGNYERTGYDSVRLIAKGMEQAGSTDPADARDALEGGSFTTVLGDITLRESDHQATNPTWIAELTEGDGEMANVDILSKTEGENALRPASEFGCEMN
ncbi:ABC transporter substrate-binding protein [Haloparvum alkalitolerans]|uniref:ABC transporter substrate-binding protein n=1 Tax=Haloparvum alkalitolerans TaxID=1042953 RepID=UPI003CE768CC